MKNTKRLLTWILVAVLVVATLTFVACDDKPQVERLRVTVTLHDNEMAVVVKSAKGFDVYPVMLGENGITATTGEDVLNHLAAQGLLDTVWTEGEFGKFITSIGDAVPTKTGEYVEVFTSVTNEMGAWAGATTYLIGDVKVVSAAVGISELTVCPGAILYFQVSTY